MRTIELEKVDQIGKFYSILLILQKNSGVQTTTASSPPPPNVKFLESSWFSSHGYFERTTNPTITWSWYQTATSSLAGH